MKTQVGIVGAGPAGLTLGRLLERAGIESVILENRSRDYCEHRVRAGVLEQGIVDLLRDAGVGERMDREGIPHGGIYLQFDGERHHVPMQELTGRGIMIYGQTEVVKDLIAARIESGLPLHFEAADVSVHDLDSERPRIRWDGDELECDVIAGCDGFHGVCRPSIPDGVLQTFEREYSFGWLGILAQVAPSMDELSTRITTAASRCSRCARRSCRATTCRCGTTRTSRTGRTTGSGRSCRRARRSTAGSSPTARSSRRASRGCAASSPSRCSSAGSTSRATRRTSCRRPARRA